ncbi:hypothetical protein [Alteromonas sp. C1M14]|uniref:hypothetical protein n=1 Tax=Alteromonas sp. C1M14 TaxID=2841567 RepID=UPI001C09E9AE|nr:hypothetical protein [Alteromonas sp. C1M14]MBU2979025.1 hypothetical protein [Alteromonas sp. C1M14]
MEDKPEYQIQKEIEYNDSLLNDNYVIFPMIALLASVVIFSLCFLIAVATMPGGAKLINHSAIEFIPSVTWLVSGMALSMIIAGLGKLVDYCDKIYKNK